MKRTERIGAIIKILSDSPSRPFGLSYFCDLLGAAKSSISEDLKSAREIVSSMELGLIETIPGARGGVIFIPHIYDDQCLALQQELCDLIKDPFRMLGGGFLYTSDIMFNASLTKKMALVFARKFRNSGAEYVATIETKGIPLALMTSWMLNIPAVVVRRET
ncbi:MAG TPA: pur operon repressor, partial [Bacillota bacterium]|nr:pur operon repressor [Bacillota bacterium]